MKWRTEIKRRLSGVICKERAALRREGAEILLNGARPGLSHLIQSHGSRRGQSALDRFCDLCEELGAVGVAYVAYMREAYVQPNSDNLRVTFDRQLYGQEFDVREGLVVPTRGVSPNVDGVILELKFVDRFPCWMRDMVRGTRSRSLLDGQVRSLRGDTGLAFLAWLLPTKPVKVGGRSLSDD